MFSLFLPYPFSATDIKMLRFTLLRFSPKKMVFQMYCRDQLLVNYSLRNLTPAERRTVLAKQFKELPEESLADLRQRAAIEESRLAALQRAAAAFRPLTPYEFFVKEQQNNPAISSATTPRDREVRLLQIYETLPDNAKEALASRAELYNTAHAKVPAAPGLPVVAIRKQKPPPPKKAKKAGKKKKKALKKKKASQKLAKKAAAVSDSAEGEEAPTKQGKRKKTIKSAARTSPYGVFVKEQMASLHHLAPKERMRVIGERWRSLTPEERQQRLDAAKAKIAAQSASQPPDERTVVSSAATASSVSSSDTSSPAAVSENNSPNPTSSAVPTTQSGGPASSPASTSASSATTPS